MLLQSSKGIETSGGYLALTRLPAQASDKSGKFLDNWVGVSPLQLPPKVIRGESPAGTTFIRHRIACSTK